MSDQTVFSLGGVLETLDKVVDLGVDALYFGVDVVEIAVYLGVFLVVVLVDRRRFLDQVLLGELSPLVLEVL